MESKIVVFDMDDTLIDSHRRYEEGAFRLLDEAGIPYDAEDMIARTNPLGIPGTAALYGRMGVPGTQEEIMERLVASQESYYAAGTTLFPGVREYLVHLQRVGARLFVLTASPHRLTDSCLRAHGVYDLFERVWCTEEFGHSKREEALFRQITAVLGCAPEDILYFDDSTTAVRTARSAGWRTCGVQSPFAREGQGITEAAHACIHRFEECL